MSAARLQPPKFEPATPPRQAPEPPPDASSPAASVVNLTSTAVRSALHGRIRIRAGDSPNSSRLMHHVAHLSGYPVLSMLFGTLP